MLIIGLAGGVASGKSLVARCFEYFGAAVLDADRLGHEVLREPEVIAEIVSNWGECVVKDGEIDRSALGKIVFDSNLGGTNSQLKKLEQITHPRIGLKIRQQLSKLEKESNLKGAEIPAVVLDAPVMFKAGWDKLCDKIVFVDAEISIRQQRARQRGWNPDELARREAYQTPLNEKRKLSTSVIQNSNSKIETLNQVRSLWQQWNLPLPRDHDLPTALFSN